MLRGKGCWMRRGDSWLRHLPVGCRSHFLPKNFELLPGLCVLHRTHGFYLWSFHNKLTRYGVVLMCVIVCDLQCRYLLRYSHSVYRLWLASNCWASYRPLRRDLYPLSCASLSITLDLYQSLNFEWSWGRWKLGIKKRESKWQDVSSWGLSHDYTRLLARTLLQGKCKCNFQSDIIE